MPTARLSTITQKQVAAFLKPRPKDSHKGQFGRVLILGGTDGLVGAPLLAGRAALKLGAGCVHIGLLVNNLPVLDMLQPELMLHRAQDALRPAHPSIIAIGCGMGDSIAAQKLLQEVLRLKVPLVLDADALNLIARHSVLQDDLRARQAASVITPHPGEAARLLGVDSTQIQADRTKAAQQLAAKFKCSIVLKGAGSLCVTHDCKIWINKTGNPGMSGPGMGDVLSGMIAAFIAQGLDADQAMLLAVHLHGAAADALAEKDITVGMTASEVTDWARWLLNNWLRKE